MTEKWTKVSYKGYDQRYEISTFGNLRNIASMKMLKPKTGNRYGLHWNSATKYCKTDMLVALAFIPNPDNKTTVVHKNNNPKDNHVVGQVFWCHILCKFIVLYMISPDKSSCSFPPSSTH